MHGPRRADALLLLILVAMGLSMPRDAYAYIDVASGSIILQAALAGLFAAMLTLKVYWQRAKDMFHRLRTSSASPAPTVAPPTDGE